MFKFCNPPPIYRILQDFFPNRNLEVMAWLRKIHKYTQLRYKSYRYMSGSPHGLKGKSSPPKPPRLLDWKRPALMKNDKQQ